MKINKTLSKIVNVEENEVKYIYRITENNIKNRQAFGIEIERQDFNNGEIINLERDSVSLVASEEMKANDILVMLFNNLVSPIHLVDIVGEYSDLCAAEF
ncbi:MAG: DUF6514 family protein [Clostridium celatum]|nr:DUF6514 family protein [Clostridium celatum]